ncbi:MAG TPA: TIM barrel protein [Abditibacteriaceae bacterium]|jgi:hexulose-6-phosphate isomerase
MSEPRALQNIKAVALDVDGVLTDGSFWWGPNGEEWKRFHFLDVMGISRAGKAGLVFALISGEASPLVDRYAAKMNIVHVHKGCKDKAVALRKFAANAGISLAQIAFMGDDINDIPAMQLCGFVAAPATAHASVQQIADMVTTASGGNGAVREFLDMWLQSNGQEVRSNSAELLTSLSIMQGRLSPVEHGRFQSFPRANWKQEFARAAEAGLNGIEWIYDVYGEGFNPIETDEGIAEMQQLFAQHGIKVRSLCADWFMEKLLFRVQEPERSANIAKLIWLIERSEIAEIKHIVLPFVDSSKMRTVEEQAEVVAVLKALAPEAQRCGVELHLETDLGPREFAELLEQLPAPWIKANYDSGNSAANGYRASEEWAAYGDRIGSVHFKDRVLGGGTVPLGEGAVDWSELFKAMQPYRGPMIMQVARGVAGEETQWARHNREWIEKRAESYGFGTC